MPTYDPSQVVLTFGPHIITGYADGTFVKAERDEDTFKKYVGSDGSVTRVRNRSRSGFIEFSLAQASPSNDFLSAVHVQDELGGTGIMPATVKDLNGTSIAIASEAWVVRPTALEYGRDAGARSWRLDVADLRIFVGGHIS